MAVNQPLKGHTSKLYSVITNFDGGIDRNTADDVASDNTFKELINFTNANEGSLSKRPGVYDSYITDFIGRIVNEDYVSDDTAPIFFEIQQNKFGEDKDIVIPKLKDFYESVLLGRGKVVEPDEETGEGEYKAWFFGKLLGYQVISNNNFLEVMQDYKTILDCTEKYDKKDEASISFLMIAGGETDGTYKDKEGNTHNGSLPGLYITRISIKLRFGMVNRCWIEVDSVDSTNEFFTKADSVGEKRKWTISPELYKNGMIDVVSYNGFTYLPTGRNYIIKIDQIPESNDNIFEIIGGNDEENLYKPTPIEATKVGFNILANDPVNQIDLGEDNKTSKIKGVFYTIPIQIGDELFEQPIIQVPYNKEFRIHVMYTGGTAPNTDIQYRPNNGETDAEKNPYKKLPGSWAKNVETGAKFYNCTGLDKESSVEIKVTLGEDVFIGYITPGVVSSDIDNNVGFINEINDLVLSSTRMKVINNQLVLYGNHGYLFFSEFNLFNYFPNYYYVFASNEAHDEEVMSINYFRQFYAIFTDRRIKKMVGSFGASDFGIYPLNDFVGCANGFTVKAVGSNLLFLGNDGIYKLKQGYLGEGTENVEKIDLVLGNEINVGNTIQAFTIGSYYIVVKNDGKTWICYNHETNAFYEYNLESTLGEEYFNGAPEFNILPFSNIFETSLYDNNGNFITVPMYVEDEDEEWGHQIKTKLMTFRFADLDYVLQENKHKDGYGFISTLETHNLNMGYPTNTKKFKEIYIKMNNKSRHPIPLYATIYVDDKIVISPEHYEIKYEKETNTYYYVLVTDNNTILGEFTLGEDVLGVKTVQQVRFRIGESGRAIKIKLSDGVVDTTTLDSEGNGFPERKTNLYNFEITSIGIVYKVKKVKEG